MVKNEISLENNWREAYWEIAFWCVTSPHRIPPFPSWNRLLTLLSCVPQRDIWELIEGYGEKGIILRSKPERILRWNCISMCEYNSQGYTFLFRVQCANTVFWWSAMGYLWTQWSLHWQRKYPQMKTRRKLFRNSLVICEFISQSYTYVSCSSPLLLFLRNQRRTSLDRIEAFADKEISPVQNVKEAFWETPLWSVNSSHRDTAEFSGSSLLTLFSWNLQSEISEPVGDQGEKRNILRK